MLSRVFLLRCLLCAVRVAWKQHCRPVAGRDIPPSSWLASRCSALPATTSAVRSSHVDTTARQAKWLGDDQGTMGEAMDDRKEKALLFCVRHLPFRFDLAILGTTMSISGLLVRNSEMAGPRVERPVICQDTSRKARSGTVQSPMQMLCWHVSVF